MIKSFAFVFITLFACSSALYVENGPKDNLKDDRNIIEDTVRQVLEEIRGALCDPCEIDALEINPNYDVLSGVAYITGFNLTGLKGFEIQALTVDGLLSYTFNLVLIFPSISLASGFSADLQIYGYNISSTGSIDSEIDDITVSISGKLNLIKTASPKLSVENIIVYITVGGITAEVICDNEATCQTISDFLTNDLAPLINDNADQISAVISSIVEEIINSILGNGLK